MNYSILGGQLPVVVCELAAGEEMFTESGGMSWMSGNISMSTNMEGGLFKGLGRMFLGESMFMATYKAVDAFLLCPSSAYKICPNWLA